MEKILLEWSQVQAVREDLMPAYKLRGDFKINDQNEALWHSSSHVVATAQLGQTFHQKVQLEFNDYRLRDKPNLILFPTQCQNETE